VIIQLGYIAIVVLLANFLRRNIAFIRKSMIPVAVLGGFILLLAKQIGIVSIDQNFMEALTYHGIALGFIAMSLRTPTEKSDASEKKVGFRSGAVIVSSYMIQGVTGLIITIGLALTVKPDMFRAAGLLLPMGFGQGPGQANNIGASYEALGFKGGHSFGLSIAAAGYIVACVIGVIMLNVLRRSGKLTKTEEKKLPDLSIDYIKGEEDSSVSESIDKLSMQFAMIVVVYLVTYAVTRGLTTGIAAVSEGLAATVNTLLWGFNFIIGSALAILLRVILEKLRARGARRPYQDNYLLNRLSGVFFDIMIVAGIASINIEDIRGLVLPFVLLVIAGAVVTWFHLKWVCKAVYPDYYYEGLLSMYGMMTGTISSGVLLLREIDPELETPAGNNLVVGSSFGILLGAPVLVLVGLATKSPAMCFVTLGLAAVYLVILDLLIFKVGRKSDQK
jgi:ESS family glutamate:Na+ symporter